MLLKLIHTLVFYLIGVVTFFIGTAITIPFAIFSREHDKPFHFAARIWARMLMFLTGSNVRVSGIENVPEKGGLIFASNHQGILDILIHLAYLPRHFRFVAKSELFRVPFLGWYMSLAGYVPIERDVSKSAHRTIGTASDMLAKGECILIFPEGTRSKTGELGPFKRGSLMAAFSSGAGVVPIAINGSYQMMPKRSYIINRVPIRVNIGKPIPFEKYAGSKPTKNDYETELSKLREEMQLLLLD